MIAPVFDEPFAHQPRKRLTDGRRADPQAGGHLRHDYLVAGMNRSGHQALPESSINAGEGVAPFLEHMR